MKFYALLECCRLFDIEGLDFNASMREKIQNEYPELKLSFYASNETERLEEYLLNHDKNFMLPVVEAQFDRLLEGFVDIKADEDIALFYVKAAYITAIHGVVDIVCRYQFKLSDQFLDKWKDNGFFRAFVVGRRILETASTDDPLKLPFELDTPRARKYICKAIELKLITPLDNGLRWNMTKKGGKVRLAYFLYRVYCQDDNNKDNGLDFPDKPLSILFAESRLGKARGQITDNKKQGYKEIDSLFE